MKKAILPLLASRPGKWLRIRVGVINPGGYVVPLKRRYPTLDVVSRREGDTYSIWARWIGETAPPATEAPAEAK